MKITFLGSGTIQSNFSYRMVQVATVLRRKGHEVRIIVPSADKYNDFVPEKINSLNGVRIQQPFQFKTRSMAVNLFPYIISAAYMLLRKKSDVVYIYKPTPISIVGLLAKFFQGSIVVLDMDDLGSEVMKIEGHPAYQRLLVKWSEMLAGYYADKIIVASTFLYDLYKNAYPKKPVRIVPNGVDSEWLAPLSSALDKKRIVFMGAINRKNILEPLFDVAPALIKKFPQLEIVIMGDGAYLEYFKQKSIASGSASHIAFKGWMTLSKVKDNLFPGDIGYTYMPHQRTILAASNMKVSQYMARGVVPLVSDVGDLPAAVNYGNAGYVAAADNNEALQQSLMAALQDTAGMEKSAAARRFAEQRYDWNTLGSAIEAFLGAGTAKQAEGMQRVYVVATSVPANVGGAEIRNFNLIKQLKKKEGITIDLFCIAKKDPRSAQRTLEKELGIAAHVVSSRPRPLANVFFDLLTTKVLPVMQEYKASGIGEIFFAACQERLPDAVHIEQLTGYYCIRPYIAWLQQRGVKIIFDTHNVEASLFESSLALFPAIKRMVGKVLLPPLRDMEIEANTKSTLIVACSDEDAEYFKKYSKEVRVIPNGVDTAEFAPYPTKDRHVLLFIGGVAYPPNADAVLYYLKEIHPTLKNQITGLVIKIIGATPQWLQQKGFGNDASIEGLGFVQSVGPYLDRAEVGICPVRYGSGTRLKILTYMSAGLPVVSTSKGVEGIAYEKNGGMVIADDAKKFSQAVFDILSDNMQYKKMSSQNRSFVLQHYDWNIIGKALLAIYE
jgi:glycosyltransferase involved in cell wall biosynthesis